MPMLKPRRPAIYLLFVYIVFVSCLTVLGQAPFDKAEFAARRAKVFEKIGDGSAIVFANEEHIHAVKSREAPDFYYLTGIEEPNAVLLLVGKTKQTIVAASKKVGWKLASEGPGIRDIPDAAKLYGVDRLIGLEDLLAWLKDSNNRVSR